MATEKEILILLADDDDDDRFLVQEAWEESRLLNQLHCVVDGVDLMDYLHRQGQYEHLEGTPYPDLVLLDLNMPKKDGREALKEIKEDPRLRTIPVVILTTSKADEDIFRSYNLGANSFVTKPVTFDKLVGLMKELGKYWFKFVELPKNGG